MSNPQLLKIVVVALALVVAWLLAFGLTNTLLLGILVSLLF